MVERVKFLLTFVNCWYCGIITVLQLELCESGQTYYPVLVSSDTLSVNCVFTMLKMYSVKLFDM